MIWEFHLNNGQNGRKEITDKLIDSELVARQRANAEFIDGGYKKRFMHFSTHRTDVNTGDVVRVGGMTYLVTSVKTAYRTGMLIADVSGVRYE